VLRAPEPAVLLREPDAVPVELQPDAAVPPEVVALAGVPQLDVAPLPVAVRELGGTPDAGPQELDAVPQEREPGELQAVVVEAVRPPAAGSDYVVQVPVEAGVSAEAYSVAAVLQQAEALPDAVLQAAPHSVAPQTADPAEVDSARASQVGGPDLVPHAPVQDELAQRALAPAGLP
jgi:hypothetical protein